MSILSVPSSISTFVSECVFELRNILIVSTNAYEKTHNGPMLTLHLHDCTHSLVSIDTFMTENTQYYIAKVMSAIYNPLGLIRRNNNINKLLLVY